MRDRLCYGQVDAYALACAEDTPPMHLVPFCLAFKMITGARGSSIVTKISVPRFEDKSANHVLTISAAIVNHMSAYGEGQFNIIHIGRLCL
ncbi:unnamed protein product [Strongylus vulgaris]|uniref:Uncharacterized protein n=1 Tax=Strongylus vulgaris TaxID=40348 RepID=A0A3P7L6Z0_STRVU|nr:unnamed protein product [Strongylus vulgaris]